MKCPIETGENSELLVYSRQKLEAPRAAALEQHAALCPACRQFLEEQRAVWQALDEWEAPAIAADFDRRLYRLLESQEPASWWDRLVRPVLAHQALPLAAAACLVLVLSVMVRPGDRSAPRPQSVQVQILQPDQVVHAFDDLELVSDFTGAARSDAGQL